MSRGLGAGASAKWQKRIITRPAYAAALKTSENVPISST